MVSTLHLLGSGLPTGTAKQIRYLIDGLATFGATNNVCSLEFDRPAKVRLERFLPSPQYCRQSLPLDPTLVIRCARRIRATSPDIVHCWGKHHSAYTRLALRLAGAQNVLWSVRSLAELHHVRGAQGNHSFVTNATYLQDLLSSQSYRSVSVPNGVVRSQPAATVSPLHRELDLSSETSFIAAVGDFRVEKRWKDVVWALDLLRVLHPHVHLLILGEGEFEVAADEVRAFLDPLPARKIWGVGPVAGARLDGLGYRTIGDLAQATPETLRSHLGDWGVEIGRLARGEDLREVEPHREPVSISEENTFDADVSDRGRLEGTILTHAEAVARRLRRQGLLARTVVLKWRIGRRVRAGPRGYPARTRQLTLIEPTDDGGVIAEVARSLLTDALAEPVRLLGVGVSGLIEPDAVGSQLSLFDAEEIRGSAPGRGSPRAAPHASPTRRKLNRALDALADRFGDGVVRRASQAEARHATLSGQWKKGSRDAEAPTADDEGRDG